MAFDLSRSARSSVLAAALAAITITSCGPLSNEEAQQRYPQDSPRSASDAIHAPVPANPDSDLEDLINNGSFENKDETGRPRGWAVSPPDILVSESSPAVYPFDGGEYVMLRSTNDRYGILAFSPKLDASVLGKTIVATAQGRAPLWRYMFLSVRYAVNGEYVENLHEWPACPHDWTENIARETIPLQADPASIQVRILVRDEPGYAFCVDHVRAFVLEATR